MAKRKSANSIAPVNRIVDALLDLPAVPPFVREHFFASGRGWAFDIAWPELQVAVEYEGNTWVTGASRHTTGAGYREDVEKYNEAAIMGWCVIRVTADMLPSLTYIVPICRAIWMRQEQQEQQEQGGAGRLFHIV